MALVDNVWYVDGSSGIAVTDLLTANNSTTATLTLSITVPAGALIVVVVNEATSTSAGTCADATNGSYTAGPTKAISGAAGFLQIFYFTNSAALSAVTLTYTKQTSGRVATLSAFYATGIATSTPLDTSVTASTAVSGAAPTVTSGTPAVSGELIVGAYGSSAAAGTFTQPASTAFLAPVTTSQTQATANVAGGHINVNGNKTVTYAPTTGNAVNNALIVVGFKAASTPSIGWYGVTKWAASTTKVCGNLVIQNATPVVSAERVFVCVASTAGTGQTAATEPAWQTTAQATRGAKFTDNAVTWQEATGIGALNGDLTNTPLWNNASIKNSAITLGQVITNVAGTLILICTTAGTAGSGAEPSWAAFTNAGATTADNSVTWTTLGASFSNWAAPHARLNNAFTSTWGQAGNSFFVASEHAETQTTSNSLSCPGTAASPALIYCVTKTTVPPASANVTTGASISTNGSTAISFVNYAYYTGVSFVAGDSINAGSFTFQGNASGITYLSNCTCRLRGSGSPGTVTLGGSGNFSALIVWDNTTFQFGATTHGINLTLARFIWRNTASAIAGATFPATLFLQGASERAGTALIEGVDLSALGSNTLVGAMIAPVPIIFKDCKLGGSASIATTSPAQGGAEVLVIRSDSAGTNYRHEKYTYTGTQVVETTIVRTGGASDGTTTLSWKIVSTANSKWVLPFECIPITIWNDSTSAITTLTIYGTTTGGGVPKDDEIWADVEYIKDAGDPLGGFVTSSKTDNLAASAATNNTSDSSTWAGGGAGNGFKIVLPTFTPAQKGWLTIYVKVAKVTSTYYIDPRLSITGVTVTKSYIGDGAYTNEISTSPAAKFVSAQRGTPY